MAFDIHRSLWNPDFSFNEELVYEYIEDMLQLFAQSPEAIAFLEAHEEVDQIRWAETFLEFTFFYVDMALIHMSQADVRTILYDIFPNVVLVAPEKAPLIIAELRAFWEFLDREFDLYSSKSCVRVFHQKNIVSRFQKELSDSSKYSPMKRILLSAQEKGIDINDEAAMRVHMEQQFAEMEQAHQAPISDKTLKRRDEVIGIVLKVCKEHLNKEYGRLAYNMAHMIATVKPTSPFEKGRASSWAAGILYALGQINFLFDPDSDLHIPASELPTLFGVSQQTASNYAKKIRDGMGLSYFDPDWTLPSVAERSPMNLLHLSQFLDRLD